MKNKSLFLLIALLLLGFLGFILITNSSSNKQIANTTNNVVCKTVKEDAEAIDIVSNYPEVKDFLRRMKDVSQPVVFNAEKNGNSWNIQVAEDHPSNLATYNWYTIDSCGKLKCSFSIYDEGGKYIKASTEKEYPCN